MSDLPAVPYNATHCDHGVSLQDRCEECSVPPFPQKSAGVPGEPGSPERAAYAEAPARFARENPGVLDALAAADFRGDHPESDVDPEAEDRLDAEQGRNLVWCEPCQTAHLPGEHESVGPFPAEPAFGSPEAVEVAAEMIRPCGSCGGRGYVPDDDAGSRACRDCNSDGFLPTFPDEPAPDLEMTERIGEWKALEDQRDTLVAEVERLKTREALLFNSNREIREQRDALADALALTRSASGHYHECLHGQAGHPPDDVSCSCLCQRVRETLRKAGR